MHESRDVAFVHSWLIRGRRSATFRTDVHVAAGATGDENARPVGCQRSAVVIYRPGLCLNTNAGECWHPRRSCAKEEEESDFNLRDLVSSASDRDYYLTVTRPLILSKVAWPIPFTRNKSSTAA